MKVALVHDWLLGMRGGERCLEVFCEMFPQADLFTTFYQPENITASITSRSVGVSLLGKLPGVERYYRHLLPLYPLAAQSVARAMKKKSGAEHYDLVISISHCLAKNVPMPSGSFHLCYCLTPMRYIWDQYDAYFNGHRFEPLIRRVAAGLQRWDREGAEGVDHFVAISSFVRDRIARVYGREADVIYPPVRTDWITPRSAGDEGEGFLCVSALVPYKNVELIVQAFNELPFKLTVVGSGPLSERLMRIAGNNIRFLDRVSDSQLAELYRRAKALVFGAEEDFSMVPVEMLAAGRPVICYGKGGSLETVNAGLENPTGVYFADLNISSLQAAVSDFISRQDQFTIDNSLKQARKFSLDHFRSEFSVLLERLGFSIEQQSPAARNYARGMQG